MAGTTKMTKCLFLILFFIGKACAQDVYFVTFVKGEVKKGDATRVKVGDKLLFQEKVTFSKKDNRLILLHPQKGRFVLEPGKKDDQPEGEYLVYLKNNLQLSNKQVRLSSRGIGDLKEYFTVDPSVNNGLLFIGETGLNIKGSEYSITDPKYDFFFLKYTGPSGKAYNNKLVVKNDTLVMGRKDLVFNGKMPVPGKEVKLFFNRDMTNEKKLLICSFRPVFMSTDDCRLLMNTIKNSLGNDKKKIIDETYSQLYYYYGKPDKNKLLAIYESL